MNKIELEAENILLKQQLQELMSLQPNSETDWKSLRGTYNQTAQKMLEQAEMKNKIDSRRRISPSPEQPKWTSLDERIYVANELLINNLHDVHAVYESRERKHNAQLGLPPTLAELINLLRDQPPTDANLDAASPSLTQAEIKARTLNR